MVKVGFNPLLVCVRHGWSLYWAGSGDEEVVRRLPGGYQEVVRRLSGDGVGAGQERGPMSRCSLLRPPALTAPADQLPGHPRHNFTVDTGGSKILLQDLGKISRISVAFSQRTHMKREI